MATLKQLIESEIADFFAGFGNPGEPETPVDMQSQLLARITPLLASIGQRPVACIDRANLDYLESGAGADVWPASEADSDDVLLYAAPQLPQPDVISASEGALKSLLPDAEKSEFWFEHNGKIFFEGVRFNNAVFEACRAAMLQGAEPVSQPYTLREGVAAIRNSGIAIDAEKIQAELDVLNEPDVPDGYALVPLEPTAEMVKKMRYHCGGYDKNIKDGYKAMIAAAPQQEVK